jgi:hypothetical protein
MTTKTTIAAAIALMALMSAAANAGPTEAVKSGADAVGNAGEKVVDATKRGLKAVEKGIEHGAEKTGEVVAKGRDKAHIPTGENKAPKGADAVSPKPTP